MIKYRIITELTNNKELIYVVQSSYLYFFWKYKLEFADLDRAKEYMSRLIEKRDFKSKVIISE